MEPATRGRPQGDGACQLDAAKPDIKKAFEKGMTLKEMMDEFSEITSASPEQWKRKLKKWGFLSNGARADINRRVAMRARKAAVVLQNEEAQPSEPAHERETNTITSEEFKKIFPQLRNNPDGFRELVISASGPNDNQAMDNIQQEVPEIVTTVPEPEALAEDVGSLDESYWRGNLEYELNLCQDCASDNDGDEDRAV